MQEDSYGLTSVWLIVCIRHMNTAHISALSGIDANLMILLDALLQHQSVSKAAEDVALSQSALSHALARLRLYFKDELLTRAGRKMVITPRGEELRPLVKDAMHAVEKVFAPSIQFSPQSLTRSFSLIMSDLLETTLLPEVDVQFRSEAPLASFQALPAGMDAVDELRHGRADAAVIVRPEIQSDFKRQLIMRGKYVIVMRKGHALTKGRFTTKKYAAAEHVVVAPTGTQGCGLVDDYLAEQGLARRIARRTSSFWSAMLLISRSDYVAILPAAAVKAMDSLLGLKTKTSPFPLGDFDYDLMWHKRMDTDPIQIWFRELVMKCAQRVEVSGLN